MAVGLDHPEVVTYLARLERAASGLPPGRRDELVAEIRGHLTEALGPQPASPAAVLEALDRLGDPEEIVAAERAGGERSIGAPGGDPVPGYQASGGAAGPAWGSPGTPPPAGSPWTATETVAVAGLVAGPFVLPILGPLIGWVMMLASTRWTRGQKTLATVLCVVPGLLLGALVIPLMVAAAGADNSSSDATSTQPSPTIVSQPVTP
jgi:hypothetical protein